MAVWGFKSELPIILTIGSVLTIFVALYGLYTLIIRKTNESIHLYSHLAWIFMVTLWSILCLSTIIAFILFRENFVDQCKTVQSIQDSCNSKFEILDLNSIDQQTQAAQLFCDKSSFEDDAAREKCISEQQIRIRECPYDTCQDRIRSQTVKMIAEVLVTCTFNVYFATIIKVYLSKRIQKQRWQRHLAKHHPHDSLASSAVISFSRKNSLVSNNQYGIKYLKPNDLEDNNYNSSSHPHHVLHHLSSSQNMSQVNNIYESKETSKYLGINEEISSPIRDEKKKIVSSGEKVPDSAMITSVLGQKKSRDSFSIGLYYGIIPPRKIPQDWGRAEWEQNLDSLFGTTDISDHRLEP
ncbi:hypothetical protein G9A89_005816 [Geosiphon pyriformis]|nr:hypothetical protein G9A89_005816 [Geosiphon pyriformis]